MHHALGLCFPAVVSMCFSSSFSSCWCWFCVGSRRSSSGDGRSTPSGGGGSRCGRRAPSLSGGGGGRGSPRVHSGEMRSCESNEGLVQEREGAEMERRSAKKRKRERERERGCRKERKQKDDGGQIGGVDCPQPCCSPHTQRLQGADLQGTTVSLFLSFLFRSVLLFSFSSAHAHAHTPQQRVCLSSTKEGCLYPD